MGVSRKGKQLGNRAKRFDWQRSGHCVEGLAAWNVRSQTRSHKIVAHSGWRSDRSIVFHVSDRKKSGIVNRGILAKKNLSQSIRAHGNAHSWERLEPLVELELDSWLISVFRVCHLIWLLGFFNWSGSCWSHGWNSPDFQSDGESAKVNQRSSRGCSKSSTSQQQFETVHPKRSF